MPAAKRAANELTPHAIARELNVKPDWVKRRLVGVPYREAVHHGQEIRLYKRHVIVPLRRELATTRRLRPLGSYLTAQMVAWKVGCSPATVRVRLREMDMAPTRRIDPQGRPVKCWPPKVVQLLTLPTAGAHQVNLHQIARVTGLDRKTAARQLRLLGVCGTELRSPLSGRIEQFYPVEVLEVLPRRGLHPAAGEWLTVEALVRQLGKSRNWVERRIRILGLAGYAEVRRDDTGARRKHYPPLVAIRLRDARYQELMLRLRRVGQERLSA